MTENCQRRSLPLAAVLACLAVFATWSSCAGVRVSVEEPSFHVAEYTTFAVTGSASPESAELDEEIRRAITAELSDRGLQPVIEDADLGVSYRLSVESRQRRTDPYFDYYAVEQYEMGTMTIDLVERDSGEVAWSGTARRELRLTAALIGSQDSKLTPIEEERNWRARETVAAILERLQD